MRGAALRATVIAREPESKDSLSSVRRALDVLEVIASSPRPIPAKAVAQQLGISLGTSYRVLHTLEDGGYVVRLGHGCFGLGGKVTSLSRLFQESLDVVRTLRPALERLAAEAEEDAYLALFRGGEIAVAEVVEGSSTLHVEGLEVGFSRVAHASALGKVLLAGCPDDTIDDYLGQQHLTALTPRTLVRRREHQEQPEDGARDGRGPRPRGARDRLLLRRRAGAGRPRRGGGVGRPLDPDRSLAQGGGAPHAALRLRRRAGVQDPRAPPASAGRGQPSGRRLEDGPGLKPVSRGRDRPGTPRR